MAVPKGNSQHLEFGPSQIVLAISVEFLFPCLSKTFSQIWKFLPCYYHFLSAFDVSTFD